MRFFAIAALMVACGPSTPTCDEVEQHVAKVAGDDDRAVTASARAAIGDAGLPLAEFVPQFGEFPRELGKRCRAGSLDDAARRCFMTADRGSALDRCARPRDR